MYSLNDNLPKSYWKQMENLIDLLKPFTHYTTLTGAEESTTVSTACDSHYS